MRNEWIRKVRVKHFSQIKRFDHIASRTVTVSRFCSVKKHGIKNISCTFEDYTIRAVSRNAVPETRAPVIVIAHVPFRHTRLARFRHIAHPDRYRVTVSICYLQKARGASIEIARLHARHQQHPRSLPPGFLYRYIFCLPKTTLSISRHLIRLILLEHAVKRLMLFRRSVFHQR